MIYTSQYRYSGKDRVDITVKGDDIVGKLFAPTWDMVTDYKRNHNEEVYTKLYYKLLLSRWETDYFDFQASVLRLVDMVTGTGLMPERDITVVCFCPTNTFCHRYLFIKWLVHNWPQVRYGGEH